MDHLFKEFDELFDSDSGSDESDPFDLSDTSSDEDDNDMVEKYMEEQFSLSKVIPSLAPIVHYSKCLKSFKYMVEHYCPTLRLYKDLKSPTRYILGVLRERNQKIERLRTILRYVGVSAALGDEDSMEHLRNWLPDLFPRIYRNYYPRRLIYHDLVPQDIGLAPSRIAWWGSTEAGFRHKTRFYRRDVYRITAALFGYLGEPQAEGGQRRLRIIKGHIRTVTLEWAVSLFLVRLTGERYDIVGALFGIDSHAADTISTFILRVFCRFLPLLNLKKQPNKFEERLPLYVAAMARRSEIAPESRFKMWGMVDGTDFPVCKPGLEATYKRTGFWPSRDLTYDGHKKIQCFVDLCVVLPDGMLAHATDLCPGRHADSGMQNRSGLEDIHVYYNGETGEYKVNFDHPKNQFAQQIFNNDNYRSVFLLADAGFAVTPRVRTYATLEQCRDFPELYSLNRRLRRTRAANENVFGVTKILFSLCILAHSQRLFYGHAILFDYVCLLATNFHNAMEPNQISQTFGLPPISFEEYVAPLRNTPFDTSDLPEHIIF